MMEVPKTGDPSLLQYNFIAARELEMENERAVIAAAAARKAEEAERRAAGNQANATSRNGSVIEKSNASGARQRWV